MSVRTTVSFDEDVLERVKATSREQGKPFRETLNDLLRLAVSVQNAPIERPKFKVRPFQSMGSIPGLNYDKISELLDYAEGEDRKW